jgi:hypothetical protein
MRSIVWLAPGAAFAAALAVLVALGSPDGAFAQGMTMGTPGAKAKPKAVKPKTAKAKRAKPALRSKRAFRPAATKTCGQFKYLSKGKCLDARTTPPKLK